MHAAYVPAPAGVSSLHSNVAPASDVNVNDGAVTFVTPVGPPVINVSGGPVSTVNALVAGVGSGVPPLMARTENVYAPLAVVVYPCGDVHAAYVPAPAGVSSLHSNVEPAIDDVNVNDGAVTFVGPVGPPVMFVSGAGGGVGVAVGVGVGVAAGSTMTVPRMSVAWIWHRNVYVPTFGKVQ